MRQRLSSRRCRHAQYCGTAGRHHASRALTSLQAHSPTTPRWPSRPSRSCSRRRADSAPASSGPSTSSSGRSKAMARRSMCATRSSTTSYRGRRPQGARARSSSRSSTRCPTATARWCSPPMACPRRCRRGGAARAAVPPRCHLPAGHQGPYRGRSAISTKACEIVLIGHAGHPEVIGTMGQLPDGAITLIETGGRCRGLHAARSRQARLCHADHALGRRHQPTSSPSSSGASRRSTGRTRKTSATPPPTARRRSRRSPPTIDLLLVVGAPNSSNSQRLVEVGRKSRLRPRRCWSQRAARHRLAGARRRRDASASPPAPRRPRCWSRSDRGLPRALRGHRRDGRHRATENVAFKLPRELRASSQPRRMTTHGHRSTPTAPARAIPGPAAGAPCCAYDGAVEKELSGGEAATTNNRMELMAAIAALEALKRPATVELHTDSHLRQGRHHQLDPRLEDATAGRPPTASR